MCHFDLIVQKLLHIGCKYRIMCMMHRVSVHRSLPVRRTMCGEAAVYLVEAVFLEGDVLWQFLLGKIRGLGSLDIGLERAA